MSSLFQDVKLTSSNDDDYFVFEDVLIQVRAKKVKTDDKGCY